MKAPTWTVADQSALEALNQKRQQYEAAIRKPIDDIAGRIHGYNMAEHELAQGLIEHADELHTALEPFLIPTTKPDGQVALEVGTIEFFAGLTPLIKLNEEACKGMPPGKKDFIYIFINKDAS